VSIISDNIDDILFSKRNQSYGAYFNRKRYHKQLLVAFLISISIFTLAFLIPYLILNQPVDDVMQESPYFSEYLSAPPIDPVKPDAELLPELKQLQKKAAFTIPKVVFNDDQDFTNLNKDEEKADTTNKSTSSTGSSNGVLDGEGKDDNAIYTYVQEVPSFPGGEKAMGLFLQRNMVYPKLAQQNKIQGRVYVSFIVEKNGTLSAIKVAQGIGAGCDDEALRVIRLMPKWKAGRRQGHEVRVQILVPINFILQAKG